ncbi:hypothetical protein GCM10011611_11970 [Aliidongia dinghuensis]|uniref:Uncharacterized protein n=1 Tax=Aliidongia dinghuensis TaxID=1867774 RepID=A0A8J2YRB4_9PROT|nr:hypothetical protein GCM10011611_11970 [Aliidongia dinghuensis]
MKPFVDDGYRIQTLQAIMAGQRLRIPKRIHFSNLDINEQAVPMDVECAACCLLTRATDGFVRQKALGQILARNEPWVVPYVMLLSGEYVVEIAADMVAAFPALDRGAYANFIRENRPLMRLLRAKASSYWNCYYRTSFPDRRAFPNLVFLNQVELWAS